MKAYNLQDYTGSDMSNDPLSPTETLCFKILVIEDDEEMQRLLDEELQEASFRVTQATNGKDALTQMKIIKPDLVISDLRIPGGGLDFLRELRKECDSCRIIVLTALRDDLTRFEVEYCGVDAFLGKPVRISELLETIKRLLS